MKSEPKHRSPGMTWFKLECLGKFYIDSYYIYMVMESGVYVGRCPNLTLVFFSYIIHVRNINGDMIIDNLDRQETKNTDELFDEIKKTKNKQQLNHGILLLVSTSVRFHNCDAS